MKSGNPPDTFPSTTSDDRHVAVVEPFLNRTPFAHRLLATPAQDPHLVQFQGHYFYCESSADGISVRRANSLFELTGAPKRLVWAPKKFGLASRNIWAPEIHLIGGDCFIYFAADNGRNANHRLWVLRSRTRQPDGPYDLITSLDTGGWAIDGTVLTHEARPFLVWSGWPGRRNGCQNLYIAALRSPTEIATQRVLLTSPEQPWECQGMPICEGPQVLQRGSRTFIVYSASGSWTEHYCLGLLEFTGGDILDPTSWRKSTQPVFGRNRHAFGAGHCGFAKSPDGVEDWMLYHVKTSRVPGWSDREVRTQRLNWSTDGTPLFGSPGPIVADAVRPQWSASLLVKSA